jgi:hypothetical protein
MLFGLLAFHIYLISTDQTTNEVLRANKRGRDFTPRSCAESWRSVLCGESFPSKLPDMRAFISTSEPSSSIASQELGRSADDQPVEPLSTSPVISSSGNGSDRASSGSRSSRGAREPLL